ncbi:hypothetical protein BGP78_06445 [Pseudoalteromonas sp. MSK9-3]|uniref:hypothetical protein n=1 Tax=Pseudoalteromonas sp. MSK9-3 TaxID=1897633 RepID=UPI000E6C54A2|nr:hypothetical protein [Pseudoalteromonas sp. MSK9-3]RJE78145.1 hypothetical protein BGP78_06445 [Pseudoalteromonas sp. MSK9-3]
MKSVSELVSDNVYSFEYPKRKIFPNSKFMTKSADDGWAYFIDVENPSFYLKMSARQVVYYTNDDEVVWAFNAHTYKLNMNMISTPFFIDNKVIVAINYDQGNGNGIDINALASFNKSNGEIMEGATIPQINGSFPNWFKTFEYFNNTLKIVTHSNHNNTAQYYKYDVDISTLSLSNQTHSKLQPTGITLCSGRVQYGGLRAASSNHSGSPAFCLDLILDCGALESSNVRIPMVNSVNLPHSGGMQISPSVALIGRIDSGIFNPNYGGTGIQYTDCLYWDFESLEGFVANVIQHHLGYDYAASH